ncbi:MAG: hypothetical protein FD180_157 [Planctomycetota bacterium]|nr:MAG: hypothetical protein FD180_157 [Planctomycetota bacterium]
MKLDHPIHDFRIQIRANQRSPQRRWSTRESQMTGARRQSLECSSGSTSRQRAGIELSDLSRRSRPVEQGQRYTGFRCAMLRMRRWNCLHSRALSNSTLGRSSITKIRLPYDSTLRFLATFERSVQAAVRTSTNQIRTPLRKAKSGQAPAPSTVTPRGYTT